MPSAYSETLLNKVKERTGYPLQTQEADILEFDSELQIKNSQNAGHILRYSKAYAEFLDHFITNSCFKILRLYETPPRGRFIPASEPDRKLPPDLHKELIQKLSLIPLPEPRKYAEASSLLLFGGITRQLTSFPVDLRVETEVYKGLEENRHLQRKYLVRQTLDFMPTLDPQIARIVPDKVYTASTAMNITFAEYAARLAGVQVNRIFKKHPSRKLAMTLLEDLEGVKEPGIEGDTRVTDLWAGRLDLRSWYSWMLMREA